MAHNSENTAMRPSGLKQPSRIPASLGLLEMSASDHNARAMMPPPPPQNLKHKGSARMPPRPEARKHAIDDPAVPEPAPKRKTLAERAGEIGRANSAALKSLKAGTRTVSSTSTASSRTASSSRHPSGSSVSSRPPSAASLTRSHSGLAHSRSRSALPAMRPTADDDTASDGEQHSGLPAKRKGMNTRSLQSLRSQYNKSPPRRQRPPPDQIGYQLSDLSGVQPITPAPRARPASADTSDYLRNVSLSTAFQSLSLTPRHPQTEKSIFHSSQEEPPCPKTPSCIPKLAPKTPQTSQPAVSTPVTIVTKYKIHDAPRERIQYLTRGSNTPAPAWDTKGRLEDMELLYAELKSQLGSAAQEKNGVEESLALYKTRIEELEQIRLQLSTSNQTLSTDLQEHKIKLSSTTTKLEDMTRTHSFEVDDLRRRHRNEMEDTRDSQRKELERLQREARDESERLRKEAQDEADRLNRTRREELADRERELKAEAEEERSRRLREVQELTTQFALQRQTVDLDVSTKDRELQGVRNELAETKARLDTANALTSSLNDKLAESSANTLTLESSMRALKAKIDFLESDNQAQSQAFADIHQKMQEAVDKAAEAQEKLRQEETLRRKLHNQVQELKGNIRVFCRVRPTLGGEEDQQAKIAFPDSETDSKEVAVQGPEQKSAMGTVTQPTSGFSFDRVFSPSSQNAEIFDEISQLVQSALDGYNVCIFCYGQTGSGKTHTMSSVDGMIPRAVTQIYETAKSLEEKGWMYSMEGSFVEVYNETLNDLLGRAEEWEKKKHEIRQDPIKCKTTVTDVTSVVLDSPTRVNSILEQASRNRSVAATAANSRSSRSHSVFILKLTGENSITGERSEGTLNLVDLAGSERLSHSQATGDRLKETQSINKSLSCLGDVISALGQGKDGKHVPYRNSKVKQYPTTTSDTRNGKLTFGQLTYLLQYSLGGNSKTLMFVMISPLQAHLSETLTSLKFATKVRIHSSTFGNPNSF
ncbi:hypothetical protein MBLNU459_g0494t2 [Dothideomycetes sp. NU459]